MKTIKDTKKNKAKLWKVCDKKRKSFTYEELYQRECGYEDALECVWKLIDEDKWLSEFSKDRLKQKIQGK